MSFETAQLYHYSLDNLQQAQGHYQEVIETAGYWNGIDGGGGMGDLLNP